MTTPPPIRAPGREDAIDHGCKCPRMDNAKGEGIVIGGERMYWYESGCPLHGVDASEQ